MTRVTGTCPKCRLEHLLDDGRHVSAHHQRFGRADPCPGSGKLSKEATAENAETSRRRRSARIDGIRELATVAHDAVATGRPFPAHLIVKLCAAAMQEYRLKFSGARDRKAWFLVGRDKRGNRWFAAKADLYCTLCRSLLHSRVDRGPDYTSRVSAHTTLCALRCLSGIGQYADPKERRIPEDMRREAG